MGGDIYVGLFFVVQLQLRLGGRGKTFMKKESEIRILGKSKVALCGSLLVRDNLLRRDTTSTFADDGTQGGEGEDGANARSNRRSPFCRRYRRDKIGDEGRPPLVT